MKIPRNETRKRDVLPGLFIIGVTAAAILAMAWVVPRRVANAPADEATVRCAQAFEGLTSTCPCR